MVNLIYFLFSPQSFITWPGYSLIFTGTMKTHSNRHKGNPDTRTAQVPRSFPTAWSPADRMPGDLTRVMLSIALAKKQGIHMFDWAAMILPLGPHWRGLKKTNHISQEECRCSRKQRLWMLRLLSWTLASWMLLHSPDSIKY